MASNETLESKICSCGGRVQVAYKEPPTHELIYSVEMYVLCDCEVRHRFLIPFVE